MKHLVMGTAGHVDHGKTALIKMLTGIECDTHIEEKRRGITINLGFAYFDLPDNSRLGIVDVPGHRDFVHTMVAGASGIDFFLLVIAANSGIMPQTREHIKILETLGLKKGIIALNKIDLIDDELFELNKEEIREFFAVTAFAHIPIVPVSAKTGKGKEDLIQTIAEVAREVEERPAEGIFRMYIDRIFSVEGFGSVVTGTVLGGSVHKEDKVYLLPAGKELRVRQMEHHGEKVKEIRAGERASINLVGLDKSDFRRGMLISDRILQASTLMDVKCQLFNSVSSTMNPWSSVLLHCDTNEIQCRIHLLDHEHIQKNGTGIAQIVLSRPIVVFNGDKFVLRNTSSDATIGGGVIIDAHPLHHRRRTQTMINEVKKRVSPSLAELIASEVRKHYDVISHKQISDILNIPSDKILESIRQGMPEDIFVIDDTKEAVLLLDKEYQRIRNRVIKRLTGFHKRNPYDENGLSLNAFLSVRGLQENNAGKILMNFILDSIESEGIFRKKENTWVLKDHKAMLDTRMKEKLAALETFILKYDLQVPLMSELVTYAKTEHGIYDSELKQMLHYLASKQK